jgi:hypothetical protein
MLSVYPAINAYTCFTPLVMTANDRSASATMKDRTNRGVPPKPQA